MYRHFAWLTFAFAFLTQPVSAQWQPAKSPLTTRWAADVSPARVHQEYPRPQMVRKDWTNLNGLWDYAIRAKDEARPDKFDGQILVPFPVESALSGVMKPVRDDQRLWYRRTFKAPELTGGKRLLLHFGAVDWQATVSVNGKQVGEHKGGYDPFSLDITDALRKDGDQELAVSVWDPTDKGFQPCGKQRIKPSGIWYTAVTGIWQTVWLEPVPAASIAALKMVPDIDAGVLRIAVDGNRSQDGDIIQVQARDGATAIASAEAKAGQPIEIKIPNAKLWSPDSPHLYDLAVSLRRGGKPVDDVASYFGMRKIAIGKGDDGFNRIFLNNKPLFQFGPLDQGWWPDGLYTAPTDEALRYDIEMTKKLGFNMARKHVKVEPDRWYYHCDKLGLLVWQDMPNGDKHIGRGKPDIQRTPESAADYRQELKAMIDARHNHPCIVIWVPFNEGWGQFETDDVLTLVKKYDPSRLVDGPSGWVDRGSGDMNDMHHYPTPRMPMPESKRAVVLGEYGGLGLPLAGHLWLDQGNWGYRTYRSREELQRNYEQLLTNLSPLVGEGLAAAVYTQTTDVEGEVNGLMTYDRKVIKFDVDRLAQKQRNLYRPGLVATNRTVVPSSENQAQKWRYTTAKPADDWFKREFDDSTWSEGEGGFGTKGTPGAVVRTEWKTKDIWLRRTFDLKTLDFQSLHLRLHYDEDVEIYINGKLVAERTGFVVHYLDIELDEAARQALKVGKNTIAVHCHEVKGGQYVDVGIVDRIEKTGKGN